MVLMRRDSVLHAISHDLPDAAVPTVIVIDTFKKDVEKAIPHIIIDVVAERAMLIRSLVLSGATPKVVWETLTSTNKRLNIQSKLNLRTKLRNVGYKDNSDLRKRLTELKNILGSRKIE